MTDLTMEAKLSSRLKWREGRKNHKAIQNAQREEIPRAVGREAREPKTT